MILFTCRPPPLLRETRGQSLRARLGADRQTLERRGLFGVLTVCFAAGAGLAGLGLLVYSLASMPGRSFRFSIWQALGLTRTEVMAAVWIEYLITLAYGIVVGTVGAMAVALVLVEVVILVRVARMKAFEVLRMGTRE